MSFDVGRGGCLCEGFLLWDVVVGMGYLYGLCGCCLFYVEVVGVFLFGVVLGEVLVGVVFVF